MDLRPLCAVDRTINLLLTNSTLRHLLLGTQKQQLGAEQGQLLYGPTGTSSGNCQETGTRMVGAYTRHDNLSETNLQGTL